MVNVVDYLVEHGSLLEADRIEPPRNVLQMIERNLDRLSPDEQSILQSASVTGVQFSAAAVAAAVERPLNEIETCCGRLSRHEQFVRAEGDSEWPDGTVAACFSFRHALYRDVLYERVPGGQRVELHRRVAERQELSWGNRAAEIAAELAHHFNCANDKVRAIKYFGLAGARSVRRSANHEAIAHFTTALAILEESPQTFEITERAQKELELLLGLGTPLITIKGFASQEVESVYSRARELCQQVGEPPQLFPVVWALWVFFTARSQHPVARELGEQCLRLAESIHDEALVLEAHHALGVTLLCLGEFVQGLDHLEKVSASYDRDRHGFLALQYGQDTGVVCRSHAAWALWLLGNPARALETANETMMIASRLSQPYTLATASVICAWISQFYRDDRRIQEQADTAIALAAEKGFAFWGEMGLFMRGWALAQQGQLEDGIAQMRSGLSSLQDGGAEIMRPYFLALLAETHAKIGQAKEGLDMLTAAVIAAEKGGEHWWTAELYRLKGELTLQHSKQRGHQARDRKQAEECFAQALAIARAQQAKSLELRVAMSMSRLPHPQAKKAEVRRGLAEIYERFSEGFDTPDLREAKALLDGWS
jgi:predicted ATPase